MKLILLPAETLPPVAYVTLLEQYVQLNFCYLAVCTAAHAMAKNMSETWDTCSKGSCPDTVDRFIFTVLLLSGLGANILFALYMREMARRQVSRVFAMNLSTGPEEHAIVQVMDENGRLGDLHPTSTSSAPAVKDRAVANPLTSGEYS